MVVFIAATAEAGEVAVGSDAQRQAQAEGRAIVEQIRQRRLNPPGGRSQNLPPESLAPVTPFPTDGICEGFRFWVAAAGNLRVLYEAMRPRRNRPGDWWCQAVHPSERTGLWAYPATVIKKRRVR